jgi:hypothetical protein
MEDRRGDKIREQQRENQIRGHIRQDGLVRSYRVEDVISERLCDCNNLPNKTASSNPESTVSCRVTSNRNEHQELIK